MRRLEDSLAESILSGKVKDGDKIKVDVSDENKVIIESILELEFAYVEG